MNIPLNYSTPTNAVPHAIPAARAELDATLAKARGDLTRIPHDDANTPAFLPPMMRHQCGVCGRSDTIATVAVDRPDPSLAWLPVPTFGTREERFTGCRECHSAAFAAVERFAADVAVERAARRDAERAESRERTALRLRSAVGVEFAACRFGNFTVNAGNADAFDAIRQWSSDAAAREANPFVVLMGATGLGKTHLASAAWHDLVVQYNRPRWVSETAFRSEWTGFGFGREELIEEAKTSGLLVWDDLGVKRASDAWAAAVHEVVEWRYVNRLPTLFTTNHDPLALAEAIGDPYGRQVRRLTTGRVLTVSNVPR